LRFGFSSTTTMADETVGSTAKGREHDTRGASGSESVEDWVNQWFEDHENPAGDIVEQLLSVVKGVQPGDFFQWKSGTMKKILIVAGAEQESYEKNKCIEGVLNLRSGTPVLARSPQHSPRLVPSPAKGLPIMGASVPADPTPHYLSLADMRSLLREQAGEFKSQIDAVRDEFQAANATRSSPTPEAARATQQPRWDAGMPRASDLFSAVEHATKSRIGEDGGSFDNAPSAWAFYPPTTPGGRPEARKIRAEKPRLHAREGGEESLYPVSKAQFYPFRDYMLARKQDWQNNSLFREGLTDASVLDQLALLPASLDNQEALTNAREILVRRWLCLKHVAASTSRQQTPKFTGYALGFESLMAKEASMPEAALRTALANSKYAQRVDKAQREE
jgi:hypothetical protein